MKTFLTLFLGFGAISMIQATEKQQSTVLFKDHPINVVYCNWRGETAVRSIVPLKVYYGSTEYHKEDQWLLEVWDMERDALRVYALKDIQKWFVNEAGE